MYKNHNKTYRTNNYLERFDNVQDKIVNVDRSPREKKDDTDKDEHEIGSLASGNLSRNTGSYLLW